MDIYIYMYVLGMCVSFSHQHVHIHMHNVIESSLYVHEIRLAHDADDRPPREADAEPDRNVEDRERSSDRPPRWKRDVSRAEVRRCGADTVVRRASHDVREEAEHEGCHDGWRSACCRDGEESRVHGTNVRGSGCEEVVRVEVEQRRDEEGWLPAESHAADDGHDVVAEPAYETKFRQEGGHRDERGEP